MLLHSSWGESGDVDGSRTGGWMGSNLPPTNKILTRDDNMY